MAKWTFPRCRERKRAGCNLPSPQVPGTKSDQRQQNKFPVAWVEVLAHDLNRLLAMINVGKKLVKLNVLVEVIPN